MFFIISIVGYFDTAGRRIGLLAIMWMASLLASDRVTAQSKPANLPGEAIEVSIGSAPSDPLQITLEVVDNSSEIFQTVHYSVQNRSDKFVRSSVISFSDGRSSAGQTSVSFYSSLVPGQIYQSAIREERFNLRGGNKRVLRVDFVLFADGTTWGNDWGGYSAMVYGQIAGKSAAAKYVRGLIDADDRAELSKFFGQDPSEAETPKPREPKADEKWNRGYVLGYHSAIWLLRKSFEKSGIEGVEVGREELEKSVLLKQL